MRTRSRGQSTSSRAALRPDVDKPVREGLQPHTGPVLQALSHTLQVCTRYGQATNAAVCLQACTGSVQALTQPVQGRAHVSTRRYQTFTRPLRMAYKLMPDTYKLLHIFYKHDHAFYKPPWDVYKPSISRNNARMHCLQAHIRCLQGSAAPCRTCTSSRTHPTSTASPSTTLH